MTPEGDSRGGNRPQRYGMLLGAIVAAFAFQGIAEPSGLDQVVTSALLGGTLLLSLWAAEVRPIVMRTGIVVIAGLVSASIAQALSGSVDAAATRLVNALLVGLAPPAIVIGVLRGLRASKTVTPQAVLGVLCVYLLVGMFFASVYGSIDRLGGNPFFAGGQPATVAKCMYYSFTSLTTVGYGDLTARTNLGHTLSASEALLGQIYLVTVVAVIVANLGRSRLGPR